jgi:Pyruvate dehydrogenase complex, dehydrogenase (E1) component
MGGAGESKMTAHQAKKLDIASLLAFRDRFSLPLSDAQVERLEFVKPAPDSPELRYLKARRADLGGYLPRRFSSTSNTLPKRPQKEIYAKSALQADGKVMSTTMALVSHSWGFIQRS